MDGGRGGWTGGDRRMDGGQADGRGGTASFVTKLNFKIKSAFC